MRISTFVAAFCPVLLASSLAFGQEAATADAAGAGAAAPPPTDAAGVHEHDGFYLRLGIGLGFATGKSKPEEGNAEADVSGIGIPTELAFGGTLAPGLVLGGGAYGIYVPSPKYKIDGAEGDGGATSIGGIGPFIDYYLDPHGGAHVGATLMLANGSVAEKDNVPKASGFGFGAAIMGGYEVFVGEQWSIGVIGRIAYYNVKLTVDAPGDPKSTLSLITPAILFGATYH